MNLACKTGVILAPLLRAGNKQIGLWYSPGSGLTAVPLSLLGLIPHCLEFGQEVTGKGGVVDDEDVFVIVVVGVTGEVEGAEDGGTAVNDNHFMVHQTRVAVLPHL